MKQRISLGISTGGYRINLIIINKNYPKKYYHFYHIVSESLNKSTDDTFSLHQTRPSITVLLPLPAIDKCVITIVKEIL